MKHWGWWAIAAIAVLALDNYTRGQGKKGFLPAWLDFSSPTVSAATRAAALKENSVLPDVSEPGWED